MLSNARTEAGLESLEGNVIRAVWANIPLVLFPGRTNSWKSEPFILRQLPNKLQHTGRQPTLIAIFLREPWMRSVSGSNQLSSVNISLYASRRPLGSWGSSWIRKCLYKSLFTPLFWIVIPYDSRTDSMKSASATLAAVSLLVLRLDDSDVGGVCR